MYSLLTQSNLGTLASGGTPAAYATQFCHCLASAYVTGEVNHSHIFLIFNFFVLYYQHPSFILTSMLIWELGVQWSYIALCWSIGSTYLVYAILSSLYLTWMGVSVVQ